MNDKIKELAAQAGAVFEKTNGLNDCPQDSLVGDEIEKFAELIVKECAGIAYKSGSVHNKSIHAKKESDRIYYKIQERFGIEDCSHFGVK